MCACMKCVGVWVSGDVVANSMSVYPLHFASVSEGLGWGGVQSCWRKAWSIFQESALLNGQANHPYPPGPPGHRARSDVM